ncbi:MAG: hypothetical protein ACUVXD_05460, partial [Thermodesulfobacteriota bacterium]
MRKALIWFAISILGLAAVAAIAMVILTVPLDLQSWKAALEARASEAVGDQVSSDGERGVGRCRG